jgi:uncharacterized protein YbjT (DUF2867 family)
MKVLVIGGTGTVGTEVVSALLARNADVRVMTSSQEKLRTLSKGVQGVVGDLLRSETLRDAFKGIERVFLLTPISPQETKEGLNAVQAAKESGVKRIVYMSIFRLEDIPQAPHFADKLPIERAIKESGIPYTIIRPNNFYQNDNWFKQGLLEQGVYAQPIGNSGVNRVDVRDIAIAAANALLNEGYTGKTFPLVGPDSVTGESAAKTYSKYLGREIAYAGDDLQSWGEQAKQMMPDWMVKDLKIMYKHFDEKGLKATPEQIAQTEQILGSKPRTFEEYVKETAQTWKQQS